MPKKQLPGRLYQPQWNYSHIPKARVFSYYGRVVAPVKGFKWMFHYLAPLWCTLWKMPLQTFVYFCAWSAESCPSPSSEKIRLTQKKYSLRSTCWWLRLAYELRTSKRSATTAEKKRSLEQPKQRSQSSRLLAIPHSRTFHLSRIRSHICKSLCFLWPRSILYNVLTSYTAIGQSQPLILSSPR